MFVKPLTLILVSFTITASTHSSCRSSKSTLSFEEEALAQHNMYRKKHRVPQMKLDPKPTRACCYILGDIGAKFMKEERNVRHVYHYYCGFAEIVTKNHRNSQSDPSWFLPVWITRLAQDWANHLAQSNMMEHRPNNKYGENIFATTKKNVKGKDAVDSWYSESKMYTDYKNDPSISGYPELKTIGHFTQLVWKGSMRLGVAKATSRSGITFVVANYSPAGNYRGEYVANVLPPRA